MTAQKPVIRPAQPSDIGAVAQLCAEHAAYERAEFLRDGHAERLRDAIFGDSPRLWCLVAEADGVIVGYASCTRDFSTWRAADYLHVDCLYLSPAYRNLGIGTQMMLVIAAQAKALGCETMEWQTPAWNTRATHFYQGLGANGSDKVRFRWTGR